VGAQRRRRARRFGFSKGFQIFSKPFQGISKEFQAFSKHFQGFSLAVLFVFKGLRVNPGKFRSSPNSWASAPRRRRAEAWGKLNSV
jgi:hypothetical protein